MPRDRAFLVIVEPPGKRAGFLRDSFEEIKELTLSAAGEVVGALEACVAQPSPSHYIREGKLAQIREGVREARAHLVIFNIDLSPVQARNIEEAVGVRAVDRTGLILDIFARRAQSREGKLQVEVAQLNYLLPRLVGHGVILSRLGGGIGTRGPGEQKLEVDRRRLRERIARLKGELEKLEKHRALLRKGRRRKDFSSVAIVGYTNAGKSTLLNALTGAKAFVEDKLFATLDPMTRLVTIPSIMFPFQERLPAPACRPPAARLPDGQGRAGTGRGEAGDRPRTGAKNGRRDILFTDTVGFLRDLPHGLVEAFHSTLEEVTEADGLIHVLDAVSPYREEQKKAVEKVLEEIQASQKPMVLALNKCDMVLEGEQGLLRARYPEAVLISAKEKTGLDLLYEKLMSSLREVKTGTLRRE